MKTLPTLLSILLLPLACIDSDYGSGAMYAEDCEEPDTGDTSTSTNEACVDGMDGCLCDAGCESGASCGAAGTCECDTVVECDPDGRCWASADGWSAWAQVLVDPLSEYVAAGALVPTPTVAGDQCWAIATNEDFVICVVRYECVTLIGVPVTQITVGDACGLGAPWTSAFQHADTCWGVRDGLAVTLDTDR